MTDSLLQQSETIDDAKNYLADLVGEGKKFKTVEDLARGKAESDLYIKTLTQRQDEMRADYLRLKEDYESRAKLEELIDQMSTQTRQIEDRTTPPADTYRQPTIDPNEIKSLVSSTVQEMDNARKQEENYNLVRSKLQERYGDSYPSVLRKQMGDLGLSEVEINDMARKHPQLLLKTIGADQPVKREGFQTPERTSQRTDPFAPRTQQRTWTYYQDMRTNNPKLYNDPKTTVQMHKDALEQGDAFFDTD